MSQADPDSQRRGNKEPVRTRALVSLRGQIAFQHTLCRHKDRETHTGASNHKYTTLHVHRHGYACGGRRGRLGGGQGTTGATLS